MAVAADHPQVAQLRQVQDEILQALVVVGFVLANFLVGGAGKKFFEITLADLEGLEHLDGVFLHDADGPLQAVGRLIDMLIVGNPRRGGENGERKRKRRRDQ